MCRAFSPFGEASCSCQTETITTSAHTDTRMGKSVTITATRAQYVINQARHNAEVLQEPVAIAVVDRDAQLIGCIRSEKASTTLLDHAVRLAISASKHHFAPTARSLRRTHAGTRTAPDP